MDHIIEPAKSGRASCRKCKDKIDKGELRFGHAVDSGFSDEPSFQWYHLACAAEKVPVDLGKALLATDVDVPDKATLETTITANRKKQKPSAFPYAERAPSARSTCLVCEDKIAKDEFRIAIEREIDTGSFTRTGAGYLHPACAGSYEDVEDIEDLFEGISENSTSLDEDELDALADVLK